MLKNKRQVFEESVVIVGPVGVGKSLISEKLGKRLNMPVVTLDIMRHCPHAIDVIFASKQRALEEVDRLKKQLKETKDIAQAERISVNIQQLENDIWVCDRRTEMRQLLPNLPNYNDMGFNPDVSKYVYDTFGIVAWHFYQKPYEIRLLKAVCEQLDRPCIIDCGGGMPITLDKDYKKLDARFKEIDADNYLRFFNLKECDFGKIKNALKPFDNVVYLTLSSDDKNFGRKERASTQNEKFIATGQYDKLCTHKVDTSGLILPKRYDAKVLDDILDDIVVSCGLEENTAHNKKQ